MSSREIHKEWCKHINAASTHDEAIQTFALAIERQALERAIAMLEADSSEATEWGFERYARYTAEVADKIRALMDQDASSEKEGS